MLLVAIFTLFVCMFITSMFLGGNAIFNSFSNFGFSYLMFLVAYIIMRWFIRGKNFFLSFNDEFLISNFIYGAMLVWGVTGVIILKKMGYIMQISVAIKDLLFYGSVILSMLTAVYGLKSFEVYPYEPNPYKKN